MAILGKQYVGSFNLVEEAQTEDLNPTQVLTRDETNGDVKLTPVSFFATNEDLDGKADLVEGKVPASQLPSYVDDVLEFANLASFPVTGESGKIYVALDTNKTYRWGGSTYVEISPSLALGETSSTAYRGDRGKIAYDHTLLMNNPHGVTAAQVGLGNVNNTSDADKPISTAQASALALKANDADVVHKTGNLPETITGNKTLTGVTMFNGAASFFDILNIQPNFPIYFNLTGMGLQYNVDFSGIDFFREGVANGLFFIKNGTYNVGFGTTNPLYKVDVQGTGRFTGLVKGIAAVNNDEFIIKQQLDTSLSSKQDTLVSGTNIKTVGGQSIVGSGNVTEVQNSLSPSTVLAPSVTSVNTALSTKANLASPTFTGDPKAPTPAAGDNDTSIATTAFVQNAIAGVSAARQNAVSVSGASTTFNITLAMFGNNGILTAYVDASSSPKTIVLPNYADMISLYVVKIIKIDSSANAVTIQGDANINGASTFLLTAQYQNAQIESGLTHYWITN